MKWLKDNCEIVSLAQLIKNKGSEGPRVAVTFDDGYADNYHIAAKILERNDIPATFFISTDLIDTDDDFWWDALERIVLKGIDPPPEIVIPQVGFRWVNPNSDQPQAPCPEGWHVLETGKRLPVQRLYLQLCKLLPVLDKSTRQAALEMLDQSLVPKPDDRRCNRCMTSKEIISLSKHRLFEIGAHTVSHPRLSDLPFKDQEKEIRGSKASLEQIIGKEIKGFAYPFGTKADYTDQSINILKKLEFEYACSNFQGTVQKETCRFELPRFIVRNWGVDIFFRHINQWFSVTG